MTINLEKSLDIDAPVADVFAIWADVESHPELLPNGRGAHLEVTEKIAGERLSWRITGPEVVSTARIQLAPTGEDGAHTKMTLTAHYPSGLGLSETIAHVTASMEHGLANVGRLLRGENMTMEEAPASGTLSESGYPEVTESAAILQRSLSSATEAWTTSVNKTFEVFSTLAWLPFQGVFAQALQTAQTPQSSST
ncbi:hypothetical protein [Aquabacterium sp.]|uniref:hypothetical protein n=1 Tax=Aquabacterium sp. TaxID=1872578 RepID=UPI003D6D7A42